MDDKHIPDKQLIRAWQTGRRETAAATLHSRYACRLFGLFRKLRFPDDVCHDLVQDTFQQAFHHLDDFRFEASFKTWLFKIARSTAFKRFRHLDAAKRQGTEISLDEIDTTGDRSDVPVALQDGHRGRNGPEGRLLFQEACAHLRDAMETLAPEDRRMVRLHIEELSTREIATVLKMKEGTVKSRWWTVRKNLRRRLERHFSNLPF